MAHTEKQLEQKIIRWLEDNEWWHIRFESPSTRGLPDRICIKNGIVVFVEIKKLGGSPRNYQHYIMNELKKKGANVFWCDNMEEFKKEMKQYDKE